MTPPSPGTTGGPRLPVVLFTALASCDGGAIVGWPLDRPDPTEHPATVTLTRPDDDERVPVDATATAAFSQPMAAASIDGTSFSLHAGPDPVAGEVRYDGAIATFDPRGDLAFGTTYTAVLNRGVTNAHGIPLPSEVTWTFTTQEEPGLDSPSATEPRADLHRRVPW